MRLTFRVKLFVIVGTAGFAFAVLTVASALIAQRTEEQLLSIRLRLVPKVELGPRLTASFERLRRTFQDAAQARDLDGLRKAEEVRSGFLGDLDRADGVLSAADVVALRAVFEDYCGRAFDVTRRLINGETGEALVASMSLMQSRQTRLVELLGQAARFDRDELAGAFAKIEAAQLAASRIRLVISLACLLLVLAMSVWMSRGVLRALARLTEGLDRFGRGDFDRLITTDTRDELGDLAVQANRMAENLRAASAERDHAEWLARGEAALSEALRGDLTPAQVADGALHVLAPYLDVPAAVFYCVTPDGSLHPLSAHGVVLADLRDLRAGEGVVGQAAQGEELVLVREPPSEYLKIASGLGEGAPRALVVQPIVRQGRLLGVLVLALWRPWTKAAGELLQTVRETLAVKLDIAEARARARVLLEETQAQAARLQAQDEALRANNEELQTQQEELRVTNEGLAKQTEALDTERRALEKRNAELDEAHARLEKTAAELASVSAYKSQFLTNMSHELRTPLNSMLLLSNLLAENGSGHLTAKEVEYSRTIHSAGKDLLALINQVLDLAKVEARKQDLTIEEVPLRPLLDHVRRVFEPLAEDKGLRLVFEEDAALPERLTTDRQRVEQILRNLLGNAIKFTDEGQVTMRVAPVVPLDGGATSVAFAVHDTGIGIAPAQHARVFAPFEQLDAAADRRHGGTGLGLAISRELAQLLGGELTLQSAVGAGSTFTFTLPTHWVAREAHDQAPAPTLTPLPTARPQPTGPLERGHRCRVLVIEDDEVLGDSLVKQLDGSFEIARAATAQQALTLLERQTFDCMVLDLSLPDMDGLALLAQLTRRRGSDHPAVLVYTARALTRDETNRLSAFSEAIVLKDGASQERLLEELRLFARRLQQRPISPPRTPDDQLRLDGRKILLVDDDMRTVYALSASLRAKGAVVVVADNGRAAIDTLGQHPDVDAVLMDIMMPEMDGYEATRHIRADPRFQKLPVVALTAKAMKDDAAQCLAAGATDYLSKPVDLDRLLTVLRERLA